MNTKRDWTDSELAVLRQHGASRFYSEYADLLPGRGYEEVKYRLRKLKIYLTEECLARKGTYTRGFVKQKARQGSRYIWPVGFDGSSLPETTWQVLHGSLLGDGFIKRRGGGRQISFAFGERHCDEQREYARWKCGMMPELQIRFAEWTAKAPLKASATRKRVSELRTPTHPIFSAIRKDYYAEHKTKQLIPTEVDERLDVLGLFIWYLDDGSLGYKGQAACITSYVDPAILERLVARLNARLGLTLWVRRNSSRGLVLDATTRAKLFPAWIELADRYKLPACMRYKLAWSPPVRPQYRRETIPRKKK